jgi:phytoene dehydrogenase-like protein
MATITVVGGGLAGLVAAVHCAEAEPGVDVRLLEARGHLGGRATTAPAPFRANLGPHAFYAGPLWDWLAARDLHRPFRRPRSSGIRVRWQGHVRRLPPAEMVTAYRLRRRPAPVDVSLRDWMTEQADAATAEAVSGLAGVLTFDHDPGRLSAAFVWDKLPRILFGMPPVARYVVGGWGSVVDRLTAHARAVGVTVETGAKVDDLAGVAAAGPVILAVGPRAARHLTGDDSLRSETPRVALLDVGIEHRRGDPYLVVDLDEAAFVDRFTAVDRTLAPAGRSLVQASIGQRPDEPLDAAVERIETILDAGFSGWRGREVWRRRSSVVESTGAIDLPGSTWRNRPSVARGDDLYLCGDWVAAPGHLAEVSWASAVEAASAAVASVTVPTTTGTGAARSG